MGGVYNPSPQERESSLTTQVASRDDDDKDDEDGGSSSVPRVQVVHTCLRCGMTFVVKQGSRRRYCGECVVKRLNKETR